MKLTTKLTYRQRLALTLGAKQNQRPAQYPHGVAAFILAGYSRAAEAKLATLI